MCSDAEDTKPIAGASDPLQELWAVMVVLAERPVSYAFPKLKPEELAQFDVLVGKYAGLLPILELPSNAAFGSTALLGARALRAGQIKVASHIYEEVNFGTSNATALGYVMQGVLGFPLVIVLLFLLSGPLLLLVGVSFLHEADLSNLFTTNLFTSEFAKVTIAWFFGCWGGVVSLLLQLPKYETLKGMSRTFLRATGAMAPLIGGIFATVLAALMSAKIVSINVGGGSDLNTWLFVVVGFLAGFSERFTRNLLNVAEIHLGNATGPSPRRE